MPSSPTAPTPTGSTTSTSTGDTRRRVRSPSSRGAHACARSTWCITIQVRTTPPSTPSWIASRRGWPAAARARTSPPPWSWLRSTCERRMRFGIFDHIEPVPYLRLDQIYRERLLQIERLDAAGFYAYHLAEHHTPAIHSLAPSQNVFLGAVAQRSRRLRFGPCVYVLPLHHPLRLIEEISMLDHLSEGRLEIGVGRGGVLEAYFWGQEGDSETNYARYVETLAIIKEGLSHEHLTYRGRFHSFESLPMYLRPLQQPYPPLWYMRNPVTAAREGMHTIIVGSIDGLAVAVPRYRAAWEEHQGSGALTMQGHEPMIGLVVHLVVAETD